MFTSKQKKILNDVYSKLDYTLSSIHWGNYGKQLFKMIQDEEKDHRRFRPENVSCGLSISEAVKLFYVKGLVESLQGKNHFTMRDYIHIQQSVLLAQSLAENYQDELSKAIEGLPIDEVLAFDYAELMK